MNEDGRPITMAGIMVRLTVYYCSLRDDLTADEIDGCIHQTTDIVADDTWEMLVAIPVDGMPRQGDAWYIPALSKPYADVQGLMYQEALSGGQRQDPPVFAPTTIMLRTEYLLAERETVTEALEGDGWELVGRRS